MLTGPLRGINDLTGPGKLLFAFFAAMAETERENIRASTREGLDTAARKGEHGGTEVIGMTAGTAKPASSVSRVI